MPLSQRWTLTRQLIEERRRFPEASGELNALILDISMACKAISRIIAFGDLADTHLHSESAQNEAPTPEEIASASVAATVSGAAAGVGAAFVAGRVAGTIGGEVNVQGEVQKPLDVMSNEIFIRMNEWSGHLAGMGSEEMEDPYQIPKAFVRGKYLLVFDPLDGSSNIDVNVSVGSIFSVLRAPDDVIDSGRDVVEADFLQPGAQQVAAGYALYGPTVMMVLSVGNGVSGFTLDPNLGEFMLTHEKISVPAASNEFAINTSNARFWEPPVKRYVEECLEGSTGPREKDFNMRWIASMVAEAHRIFMRGGVFLYPRDTKDPSKPGRLRLLYEANPIGFLMEQAGGRASTGAIPVLDVQPESLHQRIGLVFGSREEVERIERYHQEPYEKDACLQLFGARSLFRD